MSDQTGLYQDGNSVFENVFIQGTLNVATANEKLVVRSDGISIDTITTNSVGNVGINSTQPDQKLDIGGHLQVRNLTDDAAKIILRDDSGSNDYYQIRNETGNFIIRNSTEGRNDISVSSAGRVGINSSIPAATLDVIGSIRKTEYEPGEIIETLIGVCDGNDVTVKSGTYTLENVNSDQVLTDTHTTISGSSIEYVPPAGTTRVCYEFWVYLKDAGSGNGSRPLVHFQSQLDNSSGNATIIDNSRHTWRFASSTNVQDVQTWVYNKVTVSIGQVTTESVANGRLVNWNSARTFRWTARRYSSSYQGQFHETNNWNGVGTPDIRVRPHVKITAIA